MASGAGSMMTVFGPMVVAVYMAGTKMWSSVDVPHFDRVRQCEYTPLNVTTGDLGPGGDIIGAVKENGLFRNHYIMVPPHISGRVTKQKPAGRYTVETALLEVEEAGKTQEVMLFQRWPVREARPVVEKRTA